MGSYKELRDRERTQRHQYNTKINQGRESWNNTKKEIKKRTKELCEELHKKEWIKLENKITKDPCKVYKLLRKTGKRANRVNVRPHTIIKNGAIPCNKKEVKEGFNEAWKTIYLSRSQTKPKPIWLEGLAEKAQAPQLVPRDHNSRTTGATEVPEEREGSRSGRDTKQIHEQHGHRNERMPTNNHERNNKKSERSQQFGNNQLRQCFTREKEPKQTHTTTDQ